VVSRGEELRQQAQRKKAIALVVLLCCAGFVWSRTLFANDEVDRTAVIASVAPSATAVARATEQDLMSIDINSFDLDLSTTAIFGGTAVAIINGEQYRNGDYLELQFDGKSIRYEVSAIHSRRVVLHLGESEFELKIANFKNASKSLNTNPGRLPGQRDSD
jgi:hypothetical protein